MIDRGAFWKDIKSSLTCVAAGFGLGFGTALPIAFLMAWYTPIQKIIEPWINFIRNIKEAELERHFHAVLQQLGLPVTVESN